jgi:DNA-binding NarL/FixJ family response regulator
MNQDNNITVIIADDHQMLREGFCTLFKNTEVKVLATAADGKELLQLVKEHQPQVVVTDIKMPVMDGREVTRIIKKEFPQIKVIGLTAYDEVPLIKDMTEAGAEGVVIKNISREELLAGLHAVKEGRKFYCSHITEKLLQTKPLPDTISLTSREVEVLKLIIKGLTNKEIANELGINARTVEFHRANIYAKTGTKNAMQLAIFAERFGV